jgi:NADH-quinone oxidoreductase subunit L
VLAWSTVSQLGYMTGALAVGAPSAALFHLLTHAAFKALLFLAAGSVIHAVGSNLMSAIGGLRARMPVTFWTMTIGLGALAGVPPLAGFWSKETVLNAAELAALDPRGNTPAWVAYLVWIAALIGVALTAWYATRLLLRTFFGESRAAEPDGDMWVVGYDDRGLHDTVLPHDPPGLMRWPVLLLAVPAALLGLLSFVPSFRTTLGLDAPHFGLALVAPLALVALGAGLAWWRWRRAPEADPADGLRLQPLFAGAFYLDAAQDRLVVRPVRALATALRIVDERVVDGAVEGTGVGATRLGGLLVVAHRTGLPRAAVAVLAGALLLSLAATLYGVTS